MSDEIRTATDLRTSIVDQRGGIERFDGPQRRLLDALVFELAKKPNEIDVRVVTDLMAMLPRPVSVPERANEPDPRQVMWEIYRTMRERGELNLREDTQVEALQAENAQLRAALAGAPALPVHAPNLGHDPINPPTSAIVPPSEIGHAIVGKVAGPDDPEPPVTVDAKANPPAAKATHASPPSWDDSDGGRAWRSWYDAGGSVGGDRWSNNNIP